MPRKPREVHGETRRDGFRSTEYTVWVQMIQRCTNPKATGYDRYGGRGIQVCSRWKDSFTAFLSDMGRKPTEEHTIERKDVDGNYEPSNCVWATRGVQARNRSTNNNVSAFGETACVTDHASKLGCSPTTIAKRLERGWSPEAAVSTPPRITEELMVEARGQVHNVTEWSRISGLSVGAIRHRLETGWSPEDAVSSAPGAKGVGRKRSVFLSVDGTTKPIEDWASEYGVKRTTIEERLKRGWSDKDAVTRPVDAGKSSAGRHRHQSGSSETTQ